MSRRITSRLAPAHGDPPEHQVAYFPALSHLSTAQLAALRAKFKFLLLGIHAGLSTGTLD